MRGCGFRLWVRSVALISNHPVHSRCVRLESVFSQLRGGANSALYNTGYLWSPPVFLKTESWGLKIVSLLILLQLCVFKYFLMKPLRHWLMKMVGLQSRDGSESLSQTIWLWTLRGFKTEYILKPKNRQIHSLSTHKNITYNSNNKVCCIVLGVNTGQRVYFGCSRWWFSIYLVLWSYSNNGISSS